MDSGDETLIRNRAIDPSTPRIPAIERAVIEGNPGATRAMSSIKAILEARFGSSAPLAERAITWGDLFARGLAALRSASGGLLAPLPGGGDVVIIPGGGKSPAENPTTPPAPTNLAASGGFTVIILTWDPPTFDYFAYAEVFRNAVDNLSTAVKIGSTTANIYDDSGITPGSTYYYWVRFVSRFPKTGPFNALAGVVGTTSPDPSFLLTLLSGQIAESQLAAALNTRLNKIEVNETAITTEATTRSSADSALAAQMSLIAAGVNTTFDAIQVWNFDADAEGWAATNATIGWASGWLKYTSPIGTVELRSPTLSPAVNGAAYQTARFRIKRTSGSTWTVDLRWKVGSTWYTKSIANPTLAIDEAKTIVVDLSAETNWNASSIVQVGLDLASSGSDLFEVDWLGIGRDGPAASTAALQQESLARATADSALASDITTLQANVAGNAAAISTEASARATADGYLGAQYTVRVQLTEGGRTVMGGFGISGTSAPGAGPTIDFGVQADKFWIGAPTGSTGVNAILPFVVQTTDQVIDGVSIPKGVYMDGAYIKNLSALVAKIGQATIDDSKIGSLSAAKLTVGLGIVGGDLRSANYVNGSAGWMISPNGFAEFAAAAIRGQLTASQIDSRGLSIRDAAGNVILSESSNLSWARLRDIPPDIGEVKEVIIDASSNFFKVDSSGSAVNTSLVLTATLRGGLTGTVVWTSTAGYGGTFPNSNSFTILAADQTGDAVTYTATLNHLSGVYTDVFTVVRLRDGTVGVNATLSNEAMNIPADAAGNVLSLSGATSTMSVYVGAIDDSANWTYLASPSSGVTITTGGGGRTVTVTAMTADAAYVDITASKSGFAALTRRFSLAKARQGTTGLQGIQGPTGNTGPQGQRGTVHVTRQISGNVWNDSEAATALAVAGYGSPQNRDMVTLYNSALSYSEQRFYSSGSWLSIQFYLSGNAFIDGTLAATKIVTKSLTVDQLSVGAVSSLSQAIAPAPRNGNFGGVSSSYVDYVLSSVSYESDQTVALLSLTGQLQIYTSSFPSPAPAFAFVRYEIWEVWDGQVTGGWARARGDVWSPGGANGSFVFQVPIHVTAAVSQSAGTKNNYGFRVFVSMYDQTSTLLAQLGAWDSKHSLAFIRNRV